MARRLVPQLICLSLIYVCSLNVRAERLPIKIYTSADGLGSSFVDYLMRDSRGFMWFCTRDGLSRFDGARFVTYRVGDKNSPPGIELISETRGGVYWITTTGGLYRFKGNSFSRPDKAGGDRPFLNTDFISNGRGAVLEDRAGNVWYTGADLYRLRGDNDKVEFEPAPLNLASNPQRPLIIFHTREAPDGCLWINTNQGLVRRLPDGRIVLYEHEINLRQSAISLVVDHGGRVWVVWGQDFYILNPPPLETLAGLPALTRHSLTASRVSTLTVEQQIRLPEQPDEILRLNAASTLSQTRQIKRLFCSSDGHIWFSTGEALLGFDGHAFHAYGAAQGLTTGMAEIAEDSAGNLWIAGQAGLLRLARRGLTTFTEADGLSSSRLFAINEGADGTLYFANGEFYLSRFDGKKFQSSRPHIALNARALWSTRYAYLSSANEWWILTTDKLYRFAASNLRKPLATYDRSSGLAANEALQVFEDSHGDIWLSQQPPKDEDMGLYRLKRGEKSFYRFSAVENLPAGKAASSFVEDRQGNLWFGFYEGGLVRFANNRFEEFTTNDGLAGGLVIDLLIDQKGRLWTASSLGGLRRVDDPSAQKPEFVSLTTANGLSSNNVRTLTQDQFGNIYAGTVRGVDQISPDGRIKHFSVNEGLAGDFVVDSHCDRQGVLWFATTNGLSRLVPTQERQTAPPKILLGGLRIAGEEQLISELGNGEIRIGALSPSRNNLQIDFFGLDFRPGESLRYQFMLQGADSDWSAATEQRTVTYANLKAGSYRFLVRAVNRDGLFSEQPAIVSFKILPEIWLRWWFLSLAALLTLSLLYSFYWYRMTRLREVNRALAEAKRAEEALGKAREDRLAELARVRTRIATDLHDDIGASLTQIAILSEVAKQQRLKGDGASSAPLESIANTSNELVETMSDVVWAINPQKDHLQDLIQRMRRFASDLVLAKGIGLDFNAPSSESDIPLGANPRREVFLIFKESLANIVKHSCAKHVSIDFDVSPQLLKLQIADDGNGFDPTNMESLLSSQQKGGHGILSMKKRALEMQGKFEIKSEIGRGTTIELELPLLVTTTATPADSTVAH